MNLKILNNTLFTFFLLLILFISIQSLSNPTFLWNELHYHFELFDLRGLAKGSLFLFSYLLAVSTFLLIVGIESSVLFLLSLFILFIFLAIDFFVQFLGVSHGFSIDEFRLSMNELGHYDFLFAYGDTIIKALVSAFIVVLVLFFIRKKVYKTRFSNWLLAVILLPILFTFLVCYKVDTYKLSSYPAGVKIPAIALEYIRTKKPMIRRVLDKSIAPTHKAKIKNIIWIIDESVTGSYLSINGYPKDSTPFLKEFNKESNDISNFGIVNSISNCSGESNLFLRIGMTPRDSKKVVSSMNHLPTIFQYAKKAGYTTWLFDSQTQKDHLQNYLTLYDKESIDHFETLGTEVSRPNKDLTLLQKYAKVINDKNSTQKNFIVVVKYGSHFPYLTAYNHINTRFRPVLEVAYGGMNMEHKEELVNTYLNSIYSSVDLYLKSFVKSIDLSETIAFYTSDHGQNILESKGVTRTHCNSGNIVKNEVSVPFFVFTKDAKKRFPAHKGEYYSQIQIFPTTLELLGYEQNLVNTYGHTLKTGFNKSSERHYLLSSSLDEKIYQ